MKQNYKNLIIVSIGLFFYSILHTIGTYGYKYWEKSNKPVWFIMFFGIFFGLLSYLIKVPLFYYYATQNSVLTYILYIVILSIVVVLYSKFILKEHIETHTYLILIIILFLVCVNEYLTLRK
jgi:hypothetical protein